MERLAQYWDDLDDLLGAVRLCAERIRRFLLFVLSTAVFLLAVCGGMVLAVLKPPMALATATILAVVVMYRSLTSVRAGAASP